MTPIEFFKSIAEKDAVGLRDYQLKLMEEIVKITEHNCNGFKFTVASTPLRGVHPGGRVILGNRPVFMIMDEFYGEHMYSPELTIKRKQLTQRLNVAKAQRNKVLIRDLERQLTKL